MIIEEERERVEGSGLLSNCTENDKIQTKRKLFTEVHQPIIHEEKRNDERVDDSYQLPNYTEKDNKATKSKLAT